MATETTNYKFIKDAPNEFYDVAKVNANLDKIDEAIEGALEKANQAFQSASDGKQVIATAITGKGVPTSSSDTFQKMATNIDSIETDKTGDATAVPGDILKSKTAYAKGNKLTGTLELTGNALLEHVLASNTFYNNDAKVKRTGTMPNRGAPAQTLTTQGGQYNIPPGYFSGGNVKAIFANLVAENVRVGVNIGGVVGSLVESPIKAGSAFITPGYADTASNVAGTKYSYSGAWPTNAKYALITNAYSGQGQGVLGMGIAIRGGASISQRVLDHVPGVTILTNTQTSLVVESSVYFQGSTYVVNYINVQYFS